MHVTEEQLNNYITDKMPKTEQLKILEHISGCSFCAGKLASAMQKKELMFIPPGLKDSILEKTVYAASPSRKIMSAGIKKIRKEFWIYSKSNFCCQHSSNDGCDTSISRKGGWKL